VKENAIKIKSFAFAIRIVRLYQYLCDKKKEYVISKQLLRCGTGVGALIRESEQAESRADFRHKLSIAQKEINETIYWLELLRATDYLGESEFKSISLNAVEIIKILTSIIKSTKSNSKINN
jgi:four helix bundle protein